MKYKDFQDYMAEQFAQENPSCLDDEMPDATDEWMCDLSVDEWLEYGNKYFKTMGEKK